LRTVCRDANIMSLKVLFLYFAFAIKIFLFSSGFLLEVDRRVR